MGKKSKKKNRKRNINDDDMQNFHISSPHSDIIVLDDDTPSVLIELQKRDIIIDSFDSYYRILMGYLSENHWLATETIAPLLSLQHDHCNLPYLLYEDINETIPNRLYIDNEFDDIIAIHISTAYYVSKKQFYTAYNLHLAMISYFSKEILQKQKESNSYIPLLSIFCSDLRLLAKESEKQDKELDPEPYMEDVANVIMSLYRICVADSRIELHESKKMAIVPLTIELFKVYFETNKMALLKPLIRAVDSLNKCFMPLISLSDLVAYNYYLGKKAIFDGDMNTANKALKHAFEYCPDRFKNSKRCILMYWLPVKLQLGWIPATDVLKDYDLLQFIPIVEGINHGDIETFRKGLTENSHFFLSSGIFLILEKLISLTYLALVKKIIQVLGNDTSRLKLDLFLHCLKTAGEEMSDLNEAGNIVANLISDGRIKGYISQSHQTIVLSKNDPFPSISN